MSCDSFKFRNKDSAFDFGILVVENPIIVLSKRNADIVEIPGKSGAMVKDLETYSTFVLPVQCALLSKDEANLRNQMNQIKGWLSGSESDLVLSSQSDKKYIASVWDEIDISAEEEVFGEFLIDFLCQPFLYETTANMLLSQSGTVILINMGTFKSLPTIKLHGNGNAIVSVNGKLFTVFAVATEATINSSLYEAYNTTQLYLTSGEFPELAIGHNEVIIPSGFTADITPNWRWL